MSDELETAEHNVKLSLGAIKELERRLAVARRTLGERVELVDELKGQGR